MTDDSNLIIHKEFVAPGVLRVSPAALKYARDFIETVTAAHGDGYIAIFGWADMVTFKTDPSAPTQVVKDFLDLGESVATKFRLTQFRPSMASTSQSTAPSRFYKGAWSG